MSSATGATVTTDRSGVDRRAGLPQGLTLMVMPLFVMLGSVMIGPVLPAIRAEFAGTPNAELLTSLLLTAPALCVALLAPVAAMLSNRFGPRRVLLYSLSLYGFAGMAPMALESLGAIFASRFLVGVAEAGIVTGSVVLVSEYFGGKERHKWFAFQNAFLSFFGAILIFTSGIIAAGGWRASFGLYGIGLLMFVTAAIFLFDTAPAQKEHGVSPLPSLKHLLLTGAIAVMGSIAFYIPPVEIAFLLVDKGHAAPATAGLVSGLAILFSPIGPLLSRRITHLRVATVLAIAFGAMGLGLAIMALATSIPWITAGMALQQIGGGLMLTTGVTYAISLSGPGQRSAYTGAWFFLYMISQFLTPVFLALLGMFVEGRARVILVAGIVVLLVGLSYRLIGDFHRQVVPTGTGEH
jgi:MFS family permease